MKLGEGGKAFFVFETEGRVPDGMATSPVISAASSPTSSPSSSHSISSSEDLSANNASLQEPELLELSAPNMTISSNEIESSSPSDPKSPVGSDEFSDEPMTRLSSLLPHGMPGDVAVDRLQELSRKLAEIQISSRVTDNGDILLDMNGYKSKEEDYKQSEDLIRKVLEEEFGLNNGEKLEINPSHNGLTEDRHAHDNSNDKYLEHLAHEINRRNPVKSPSERYESDHQVWNQDSLTENQIETASSQAAQVISSSESNEPSTQYAKTLRLTSDQLHSLKLKKGPNDMVFRVNNSKAFCAAQIYLWDYRSPVVISDIDGTITKSDAWGHVLTMLGRDWTHSGVSKLFTDISNNGYNIMYLTARSVGQSDSTRSYLRGIEQNSYKLPMGPVILSPDRTIAALRREVIMRKPEVFKMACLRDIRSLYGKLQVSDMPFCAGFGNRISDALSYRSVGVPSSKIFTINANSEVHMELLELAGYKSSYIHIADLVDHIFPPVLQYDRERASFTDVNYWRDTTLLDLSDLEDLSEAENSKGHGADKSERRNSQSPVIVKGKNVEKGRITDGSPSKENKRKQDDENRSCEAENPDQTSEIFLDDEFDDDDEYHGYSDEYTSEEVDQEDDLDADLLQDNDQFIASDTQSATSTTYQKSRVA